jgi:hypothetical protein
LQGTASWNWRNFSIFAISEDVFGRLNWCVRPFYTNGTMQILVNSPNRYATRNGSANTVAHILVQALVNPEGVSSQQSYLA